MLRSECGKIYSLKEAFLATVIKKAHRFPGLARKYRRVDSWFFIFCICAHLCHPLEKKLTDSTDLHGSIAVLIVGVLCPASVLICVIREKKSSQIPRICTEV